MCTYRGVTIKVVEPGTRITMPNGVVGVVEDNCAIISYNNEMYVTPDMWKAMLLKAEEQSARIKPK